MTWKYTSKFNVVANFNRKDFAQGSFVSRASLGLKDLKQLLPPDEEILDNPDLLYTCFNAAVVNLVNLNDDGILTETVANIHKSFIHKPMNIEHDRGEVVGFITNVGFSSFSENKILAPDELTNEPFNISLAAIVWKTCNGFFAEHIKESQKEDSLYYGEVSASWEIGFNEYWIALGSKNLNKATIIKEAAEIERLAPHLKAFGGTGFSPEGDEIYRVITGDAVFLGAAFTSNPAAAVAGVISTDSQTMKKEQEEASAAELTVITPSDVFRALVEKYFPELAEKQDSFSRIVSAASEIFELNEEDFLENLANFVKKDKKSENNSKKVPENEAIAKKRVEKSMEFKTPEDLFQNFAEASVEDFRKLFKDTIKDADDKFVQEKNAREAKELELAEAAQKVAATQADLEATKAQVEALASELKSLRDSESFNARISSLKEEYGIDEALTKTVASQISGLTDEQFDNWKTNFQPVLDLAKKSKEALAQVVEPEVALQTAQASVTPIPNSQNTEETDALTKVAESFAKTFKF